MQKRKKNNITEKTKDRFLKNGLEEFYQRYNRREYVHPDPLEYLYRYDDLADREIVGVIASSLAYGRVGRILKSVSWVLERMSFSPSLYLTEEAPRAILKTFNGFSHRFATGYHLSWLLIGIKKTLQTYGSLCQAFLAGFSQRDPTILRALSAFSGCLAAGAENRTEHLLPDVEKGSACKRLNLFLRWMIRNDAVDPGGWGGIPTSSLIVPLDTHLHALSLALGFTARKTADVTTALEITAHFRRLCPEDPVRYDFVLTRFGIRNDLNPKDLILKLDPPVNIF